MPEQTLFSQLNTTTDVEMLKKSMEALKRGIYSASKSLDQNISEILNSNQKDSFIKYLSDGKINTSDPVRVEKAIDELINELESIRVITLLVAVAPSQKTISEILGMIEKQAGKRVVFQINIVENIVGGAVFATEGYEYSYTISDKINNLNQQI